MKKFYSLLCILFSLTAVAAPPYQFERFTINEGLSNNSIRRIIQDKKGFLWFGTLNGLNRYDGKNFKVFKFEPGNLNSLSNNRIHLLLEDDLSYIWVVTFDNVVHRFDPRTEDFLNVDKTLQNKRPEYLIKSKDIVKGSPGVMWIIPKEGGLIRFKGSDEAKEYSIDIFDDTHFLPSNNVKFLHRDKKGKVWIGTDKGLVVLENDTFKTAPAFHTYFDRDEVVNFREIKETDESLWLGTENSGLFKYSFADKILRKWNEPLNIQSSITSLGVGVDNSLMVATDGGGVLYIKEEGKAFRHYTAQKKEGIKNLFTQVYADKNGFFWLVSPHQRGVTLFDPSQETFKYYGLNAEYREPLGDSEKHVFFEDSNGSLWLGLYGGGLCKFDNETKAFDQYFYSHTNLGSISSNLVLSIYEDKSKNLWVGTFHGGLNKLSLFKNYFYHTEPNTHANFRVVNEVRSAIEDKFGRLWVGTKGGKVKCYDNDNNCIYTIPDDLPESAKFHMHSIYSLLEDKDGNLWIGTKGDGLFRIDGLLRNPSIKDNTFVVHNFKRDGKDPSSLSMNTVYALLQDHYGQIWVGTYNGGLDLIKSPFGEDIIFEHYKKGKGHSISDDRVRTLMLDKTNNIWIGTSNGLNMLKSEYLAAKDKAFIHYTSDQSNNTSLSNNDIISLHQDKENNIWAGTYGGGLNKLIKERDSSIPPHFICYTQKDGLPSDVIYSVEEDEAGDFWVSTDNGLCKFSPSTLQVENYLKEDGLEENTFSEATSVKSSTGELIFGNLDGFVRFFPGMIRKDNNTYPLVFTDLLIFNERVQPNREKSPLKHSIETTREITLNYDQNFIGVEFAVLDYKAPEKMQYSYILEGFEEQWNYIVGQNRAVYRALNPGEYTFKVKGTNSDGVWMDEPKTLKITILPPFWKTNWAYTLYTVFAIAAILTLLFFVRHEMRLQNKIILGKKLTENKLRFYTNISHEFKTPLTLILGPVDDLLSDATLPPRLRNKMEVIKRNSKRLMTLIEQLLDFRKIQSDKMGLKVQSIELYGFFHDFYISFLPLAEKKQILLHFKSNFKTLQGWIDPDHLEKIVMNLLSNAFKYASAGKNIYFEVTVDNANNTLKISVKDQGKGISEEQGSKIFERFSTVKNDRIRDIDSSGIGLSLTQDLTHLHKGKITVNNNLPKGCEFIVTIPIGEDAYSYTEKATISYTPPAHNPKLWEFPVMPDIKEIEVLATSSAVKHRLLLIEDNDDLREYLAEKLRKYYVVATAPDGAKGFEMAVQSMPDLIVCDIMMPGISGLKVTKKLKQHINTSHIPVVLLTARSSKDQQIEGIEIGADAYITKPFDFEFLQIRIQKIIEQRKKLKEKFSNEPSMKVSELSETPADQKFLEKAIGLIEERMENSEFNVDQLVKEMSCSRTFFYKKLKRISGHSPNEFVRIIRMKKAALMLKSGDFTVAEISYKVGISDPNYFSKCFKTHFGESPSEYSRNNKANV